jgi:hypothetical protein
VPPVLFVSLCAAQVQACPTGEAEEGAKRFEATGDIVEHPGQWYQAHEALGDGWFPVLLSDILQCRDGSTSLNRSQKLAQGHLI